LVQQGIITDEEYASAVNRSQQSGHSVLTTLRGTSLVLPTPDRTDDRCGGGGLASTGSEESAQLIERDMASTPFRILDASNSVPTLVSNLFEIVVQWGATDLHFDPTPSGARVRARLDGLLHDVGTLPDEIARRVRARIKLLAGIDPFEKRAPRDGHVCVQESTMHRDFRVATLPTGRGERMVIRSHQVANRTRSLDALGFEMDQVEAARRLLGTPHGLVLVAGPTGSGKTTTLYACLQSLAVPTRSLLTIEDPIEYDLDGVTQIEVHRNLGVTFARGLRAILRQDPDVIMVGEIRDRETARVASRAAAVGTLVLSSVHAADGPGVLRTLSNYNVSPHRVVESLSGIIVQRLLRTLCDCKRPAPADGDSMRLLGEWGLSDEQFNQARLYEAVGCPRCLGTGYRGRTGVFEVIEFADPITRRGNGVRGRSGWDEAITDGRSCDLLLAAARKVVAGITTIAEVQRLLPTFTQGRHHTKALEPTAKSDRSA
jgi:type II secretory ATPase GspE/PulE/Tfp pilus assembly ATPase PilB-like protein